MANTYFIGTTVRSQVTFKDTSGTLSDPTTVQVTYMDPTGAEFTKTLAAGQVIKASTGVYYFDIDTNYSGNYQLRWLGGGSFNASGQDYFIVKDLNV